MPSSPNATSRLPPRGTLHPRGAWRQSQRSESFDMSNFSPASTLVDPRSPLSPSSASGKPSQFGHTRSDSGVTLDLNEERDIGIAYDPGYQSLGINFDNDGKNSIMRRPTIHWTAAQRNQSCLTQLNKWVVPDPTPIHSHPRLRSSTRSSSLPAIRKVVGLKKL